MTGIRSLLVAAAIVTIFYFFAVYFAVDKASFATTLVGVCLLLSTALSPKLDLLGFVRKLNLTLLGVSIAGVLLIAFLLKSPSEERIVIGVALLSFALFANVAVARMVRRRSASRPVP